jgi:hypothetical protein
LPASGQRYGSMDLASLVKKYLEIAGGFERPVHLSKLGLTKDETEKTLSTLDEDYQISRYLQLTRERDEALRLYPPDSRVYVINRFECSHLSFHADIQKLM